MASFEITMTLKLSRIYIGFSVPTDNLTDSLGKEFLFIGESVFYFSFSLPGT